MLMTIYKCWCRKSSALNYSISQPRRAGYRSGRKFPRASRPAKVRPASYYAKMNRTGRRNTGGGRIVRSYSGYQSDKTFIRKPFLRKYPNRAFGRMMAKAANSPEDLSNVLSKTDARKMIAKFGGRTFQPLMQPPVIDTQATAVSEIYGERVGRKTPGSEMGVTHITHFHAGKKSTRSLMRYAKDNGYEDITYYSSRIGNPAGTDSLELRTGLNQRGVYWFTSAALWTYVNMEALSGISGRTENRLQFQRTYWLVQYFGNRYTFYNKNAYVPMYVTIHFVAQQETSDSFADKMVETFSNDLVTQKDGAIPLSYQLGTTSIKGATTELESTGIVTDPKLGRLTTASNFNNNFKKIKSFTKKLLPGEVWRFDYRHHMGPGVKLGDIFTPFKNVGWDSKAAPLYAPIFEVKGATVQAYQSTDESVAMICSSSGAVQVEIEKYARINSRSTNLNDVYDSFGEQDSKWAFKTFTAPEPEYNNSTDKIRNVSYSDVLKPGEATGPTKWIVPISTETTLARGGRDNLGG